MGNELSTDSSDPSNAAAMFLAALQGTAAALASSSGNNQPLLWDPKDCSDNLEVFDNGSKVRRKDAPNRTDMVRATQGYRSGVHVWEITWPRASRGTHAVIGVTTTRAPLTCSEYKLLLGSNDQSLGWDIINNKSLYDNRVINSYPPNKSPGYQVGDRIIVILNLKKGTISFCDGDEKLGLCLSGLELFARNSQVLCPAVSITEPGAVVEIRDLTEQTAAPSAGLVSVASTALHFTIPNDDMGFKLTNDSMSALVCDASVNNKMALSHRPLEDDELFQIKIDKLENDETVTPVLLHVGLVDDRSDNTQQWTLTSSHILYKGEKLQQFTKLDVDELKQGQRVGLMRRSNGRLDVYVDGKLKAKCNINIPRGVRAYVGLDGRAKQVTIVPERVEMASLDANTSRPEASAQLRFGGPSGANIDLCDDGRTVSRKDCSLNDDNGVAMAARPLKVGELFEVRVDEVIDKWEAGLRIGVVQSASSAWDSSVPVVLSRMQEGSCRVWLWSGETVMGDGSMLTDTSINLDNVKKGDRVGLYQTSDGDLLFIHNGDKVAQVSNVPMPVTPAVDIYGRIARVSLTDDNGKMLDSAGNWQVEQPVEVLNFDDVEQTEATTKSPKTPEEMEKGIEQTLALMNEKNPSSVKDVVAVAVWENIITVRAGLTSDEHRVLLADKIAELGGGPAIVGYLYFLRDQGLEIDNYFECYCLILNALWNETDDSMKLSMTLAENGLFELLHKQLTSLKIALVAEKQKFGHLFGICVGIVCNCTKRSENRNHLLKVKLDEVLQHFVNISDSDENTILFCYVSVMFIFPSKAVEQLVISIPAIRKLVGFLEVAAADSDGGFHSFHDFSPLGEVRMHGFELVMAVSALAQNKVARKDMADNGVFEHLVTYGTADTDTYHQELTLTAIHTLLGHDTVPIALRVSGLLPFVDRLMTSTNDGVRQAATRVREKIKALKIPPKPATLAGMSQLKPKDKTKTCDFALRCQKFFAELKLPDVFFDSTYNICYCAKCYEAASSNQLPYHSRGQPAKDYGIPIGWYRYGLKVPPKAAAEDAFNVYHRAYHGTGIGVVPQIIREGHLLIPGDETMDGARIREKDGHFRSGYKPRGFDTKQVFLSPSIRYVAYPTYAKPSKVTIDGKEYKAQVVLQVLIKPDAYTVGHQTVGAKTQIDPRFSNDEMEWSTKRRGAVILYGLLFRVMEE